MRETISDSVSSLELLDDGGDDHAGGGAGDARLAVEDDGRGGRGALQDAHDLVEAALVRRSVLVQRDPQRLDLFVLPRGRKKKEYVRIRTDGTKVLDGVAWGTLSALDAKCRSVVLGISS